MKTFDFSFLEKLTNYIDQQIVKLIILLSVSFIMVFLNKHIIAIVGFGFPDWLRVIFLFLFILTSCTVIIRLLVGSYSWCKQKYDLKSNKAYMRTRLNEMNLLREEADLLDDPNHFIKWGDKVLPKLFNNESIRNTFENDLNSIVHLRHNFETCESVFFRMKSSLDRVIEEIKGKT